MYNKVTEYANGLMGRVSGLLGNVRAHPFVNYVEVEVKNLAADANLRSTMMLASAAPIYNTFQNLDDISMQQEPATSGLTNAIAGAPEWLISAGIGIGVPLIIGFGYIGIREFNRVIEEQNNEYLEYRKRQNLNE